MSVTDGSKVLPCRAEREGLPKDACRRLCNAAFLLAGIGLAWSAAAEETLLQKVLRVVGIAAAPTLRTGSSADSGAVWVADVAGTAPVRWTRTGGFRSPVFDVFGRSIYVMQQDLLVRIDAPEAAPVLVRNAPGVEKLVGFDPTDPDKLLVLTTNPDAPLAELPLGPGAPVSMSMVPGPEMLQLLAQLRGQDRVAGGLQVQVAKKDRQDLTGTVEWTDIVVQSGAGAPRNLSSCNGAVCSQPALAPDSSRVAYVRSRR